MATYTNINEDIAPVPVNQSDLSAVSNATFYNPHEVLGGHLGSGDHAGTVTIRVLRPLAKSVTIYTQKGTAEARHEFNGVFVAVIAAEKTADGWAVPDYRVCTTYEGGKSVMEDDPYRYLPSIGDMDAYLFGEGRHERLWEALGARVRRYDDPMGGADGAPGHQVVGTSFTVWAPNAHAVRVVGNFNSWDGRRHAMRELGSSGIWEIFIPGVKAGEVYKYELLNANHEWKMKADPMERSHEIPPATGSIVVESDHEWNDEAWMDHRRHTDPHAGPVSIYEVHAGSWKKGIGNYRELADELVDYVAKEGFTHVEFMPLTEHPFSGSWGYQVTGYYAVDSRLGNPDDFKYLVDKFHRAGIGVIMDWVPGHFCQDAQGLAIFNGHMLYESEYHPNWGTYKFDFGRPEVVSFLLSNAIFWVDQFHVDGLRVDGVSSMLYLNFGVDNPADKKFNELGTEENLEASAFLRNVNGAMGTLHEDVMMIAEESTALPLVTYPPEDGGLGFQLKWDMGWMNDTLHYMQTDFPWRPGNHNLLTFSIMYAFSENYVLPLSHDEVVNGKCSLITRMPGDQWRQFAGLRCLSLYQMTHPGAKLNFMGNEIGQYIEWRYYESIQWFLAEQFPLHAGVQEFVRTVNHLYTQEPALWQRAYTEDGFEWINANDSEQSVISYVRHGENPDDDLLVVINLTPAYYESFRVGVPREGKWKEILNSDDTRFGGSGKVNPRHLISRHEDCDGREYSILPQLPPLAGVVFKRTGTAKRKPAAKKSAAAKKPAAGKTTAKPVASKAPAKPTSATKAQAAKKAAPAPAAKPAAKKPSAPKAAVKKESTSVNSAGKRKRAK